MKKCHAGYPVAVDCLLMVLLIAGAIALYFASGHSIPVHYNLKGEADAYGHPSALLFIPVLPLGLVLLFRWVKKFPDSFNYPVKLNENNKARQQQLALALLDVYGLVTLILFNLIQVHLFINTITGSTRLLWIWGLVFLAGYLIPIPVYIRKARRQDGNRY